MAQQTVPSALARDMNNIVVSAMKRSGPGNELGIHQSWLGLLLAYDCLEYKVGGGEKAAKLHFPYASPDTGKYRGKNESPVAAGNESVLSAEVSYTTYEDVVNVHNMDNAASRGGYMRTGENSLWTRRLKESLRDASQKINDKLVNGLGTNNEPLGLFYWVNDTTNLGGTIDQAVQTWAASPVVDASGNSVSRSYLRQLIEAAQDDQGFTPDFFILSQRQLHKVMELFDSKVEYSNIQLGPNDIQFRGIELQGIPFIPLQKFSQSEIVGVKMEHWKLTILLQEQQGDEGVVELQDLQAEGLSGVPFKLRNISTPLDEQSAAYTLYHQQSCRKPWFNARLKGLSTTLA